MSITIILIMKFYVYGHQGDAQEMLSNVQRFIAAAELEASIYEFDSSEKQENHDFDLTPALFLDGHLLIEGDTPGFDETGMLISVAVQLYGYAGGGGGCCGGSGGGCGCGGAGRYEEGEEYVSDCGCSDGGCEDNCGCGGNCTCK